MHTCCCHNKDPFDIKGDVSDFHHIQGVVGDLIAVRIQDVSVFFSPPPAELPTVFWQTPRSCGNLIDVRIHISEFMRRNRFKIQCLIPFWALPNTVTLYFGVIYILFLKCWKVFKRTILHDCSTTATGSRRRRKAHTLSNGSLLWQQQVCNTILSIFKYILHNNNTFVNKIHFIYSRQSCDWPREQRVPGCRITELAPPLWINHRPNPWVLSLRWYVNLFLQTSIWETITIWIGLKMHFT